MTLCAQAARVICIMPQPLSDAAKDDDGRIGSAAQHRITETHLFKLTGPEGEVVQLLRTRSPHHRQRSRSAILQCIFGCPPSAEVRAKCLCESIFAKHIKYGADTNEYTSDGKGEGE